MKKGWITKKKLAAAGAVLACIGVFAGVLLFSALERGGSRQQQAEVSDEQEELENMYPRDNVLDVSVFEDLTDDAAQDEETEDLFAIDTQDPLKDKILDPALEANFPVRSTYVAYNGNSGESNKKEEQNAGTTGGNSNSGNTGDNGNSGNIGDNGNSGNTGDSGNSGNTGDTGNSGNTGDTGNSGNTGDTGNSGNTGDTGNSGNTGDSGNSGNTGDTGNSGNTGDTGNSGNTGDSGNSGNTGDSGNSGNTGDSGNSGNTGDSGNSGNTGDSGNSGNTGDSGNSGNTGNKAPSQPNFAEPGWIEKVIALKKFGAPAQETAVAAISSDSSRSVTAAAMSDDGNQIEESGNEEGTVTDPEEDLDWWYAEDQNADFQVVGGQIRTVNSMGLRFISSIKREYLNGLEEKYGAYGPVTYGTVVIPKICLKETDHLEKGQIYLYKGVRYRSASAQATQEWRRTETHIFFTVVLTGIVREQYKMDYAVRAYIEYKDETGQTVTLYSNDSDGTRYGQVLDIANSYCAGNASDEDKEALRNTLGIDEDGNVIDTTVSKETEQKEQEAKFYLKDVKMVSLYTIGDVPIPVKPILFTDRDTLMKNAKANSEQNPAQSGGNDGPASQAFDGSTTKMWHSRYNGTKQESETASSGTVSAGNPIWIQTGFGKKLNLHSICYQPRMNNAGQNETKDYDLLVANMDDPDQEPTDDDFKKVASGTFEKSVDEQQIVLMTTDEKGNHQGVEATHVRLVTRSVHSSGYVVAAEISIYTMPAAREDGALLEKGLIEKTRFTAEEYQEFKQNTDKYLVKVQMQDQDPIWAGVKEIIEEAASPISTVALTEDTAGEDTGRTLVHLQLDLDNYITYDQNGKRTEDALVRFGTKENGAVKTAYMTFQELINLIHDDPEGTFSLENDLDASGVAAASQAAIPDTFKGTLKGNGYKITGLKRPLFDSIDGGTIQDLVIEDATVAMGSVQGSGILARKTAKDSGKTTRIKNVHVSGTVTSTAGYTAGLIGESHNTEISQCSANVSVTGGVGSVGGMIGVANATTKVTDSYVVGTVHAVSGKRSWGGFVGWVQDHVTVERCYANVKISGPNANTGGFVGYIATSDGNNDFNYNVSYSTKGSSGQAGSKFEGQINDSQAYNAWNEAYFYIHNYDRNYYLKESALRADWRMAEFYNDWDYFDYILYELGRNNHTCFTQAYAEELCQKELYTKLGWSEEVWDFSPLAQGKTPRLKTTLDKNDSNMVESVQITTLQELQAIKDNLNGVYTLAADIDVSSVSSGKAIIPGTFVGVLYGGGYEITGASLPLFETLDDAMITNLKMSSGNIRDTAANGAAGVLARKAQNNCRLNKIVLRKNEINIEGADAAGFVGEIASGTQVTECAVVNADIKTDNGKAGGIAAVADNAQITDCYAGGTVTATGTDGIVGGMIAEVKNKSTVSRCYADAVTVTPENRNVGSFVGRATDSGTISHNVVRNDQEIRHPFVGVYQEGDNFNVYSSNYIYEMLLETMKGQDGAEEGSVYGAVWDSLDLAGKIDFATTEDIKTAAFYEENGFDGESIWNLDPVAGENRPKLQIEGEDYIYETTDPEGPPQEGEEPATISIGPRSYFSASPLAAATGNTSRNMALQVTANSDPKLKDDPMASVEGYKSEMYRAYQNLSLFMPFYSYDYIVYQGNKLSASHKLNRYEVEAVLPLDSKGSRVIALKEGDQEKLDKIRVQFTDHNVTPVIYNLQYVETKDGFASYRIAQNRELHYLFPKPLIKTGENSMLKALVDVVVPPEGTVAEGDAQEATGYDFDRDLEGRLKDVDVESVIDSYRRNYKEVVTKEIEQVMLSFLANNRQYPANIGMDNEVAKYLVKNQFLDNDYLKDFLYVYNYIDRWYDFEVGGVNMRDLVLFDNSILPDSKDTVNLVTEICKYTTPSARQGTQTNALYKSYIAPYMGQFKDVASLLEYFMAYYANYENVNDWIMDNFQGGVVAEAGSASEAMIDPSEQGKPYHKNGTRLWRVLKRNTKFKDQELVLPALSYKTSKFLYLGSFTSSLVYGNLQIYTTQKEITDEWLAGMKRNLISRMGPFKDCYDNYVQLSPNEANTLMNCMFTIIDTSARKDRSQDVFQEFYRPLGTLYEMNNGAVAFVHNNYLYDYIVYNSDSFLGNEPSVLSHEMGHVTDYLIWMQNKGKRAGRNGEDYCNGFANQYTSTYNMTFMRTYGKDSNAVCNLTPQRLVTEDDFKSFYDASFKTMYLLDYLQGLAYLELTPEQQAPLTFVHWYGNLSSTAPSPTNSAYSTWRLTNVQQIEDLHLETLEDLWDAQLVIRPGLRYENKGHGDVGINDAGAYQYEPVGYSTWYEPFVNDGTPNAQQFRRNGFMLGGIAGYSDGLVKYLSGQSSNRGDLDVFKDIFQEKGLKFEGFKEYRMDQYDTIAKELEEEMDQNPYFDKDAVIEYLKQALLNPGYPLNQYLSLWGQTTLANVRESRENVYRYLQRVTNDFRTPVFGDKDKEITEIDTPQKLQEAMTTKSSDGYIEGVLRLTKDISMKELTYDETNGYYFNATMIGKLEFNGHKITDAEGPLLARVSNSYVSDTMILDEQEQEHKDWIAKSRSYLIQVDEKNREKSVKEIHTLDELKAISSNSYRQYKLMNDIDASSVNSNALIANRFTSVLDGNGYAITGLKTSLFENVDGGTVKNLVIKNAKIDRPNSEYQAVLAKKTNHALFEGIDVRDATVSGKNYTAVITGYDRTASTFNKIQIRNSQITSSGTDSGLFAGRLLGSKLNDINVIGSTASLGGKDNGGLIGHAKRVTASHVFCGAQVTVTAADQNTTAAGLIGEISGKTTLSDIFSAVTMCAPTEGQEVNFYRFTAAISGETTVTNAYELEGSGKTNIGSNSEEPTEPDAEDPEESEQPAEPAVSQVVVKGLATAEQEKLKEKTFYSETLKFNTDAQEKATDVWFLDKVAENAYPELKGMTSGKVYIANAEEFIEKLSNDVTGYEYTLSADIDFSNVEATNGAIIPEEFTEVLDGAGHTITGLKVPLFAKIQGGNKMIKTDDGEELRQGTIYDLKFRDIQMEQPEGKDNSWALLAAETNQATIEKIEIRNVRSTGKGNTALLSGKDSSSTFSKIQVQNASIEGAGSGHAILIGEANGSVIKTVAVLNSRLAAHDTKNGGFIGSAAGVQVSDVFADVDVTIERGTQSDSLIAGFVGEIADTEKASKFTNVLTAGNVFDDAGEEGPAAYKFTANTEKLASGIADNVYERLGSEGESNASDAAGIQAIETDLHQTELYSESLKLNEEDWELSYTKIKGYPEIKGMADVLTVPVFDSDDFEMLNTAPQLGYVLEDDLDLSGKDVSTAVIHETFTGKLDGNGHTISGLTTPLFKNVDGGKILNLTVKDVRIRKWNSEYAVALAEKTRKALIERIHIQNVDLSGSSYIAPVVGYDEDGSTFSQIQVRNAVISSSYYYGSAFVGRANNSEIKDIAVIESSLQFKRSQNGGLIGLIEGKTTVERVYADVEATAEEDYNDLHLDSAGFIGKLSPECRIDHVVTAGRLVNHTVGEEGGQRYQFNNFTSSEELLASVVQNSYAAAGPEYGKDPGTEEIPDGSGTDTDWNGEDKEEEGGDPGWQGGEIPTRPKDPEESGDGSEGEDSKGEGGTEAGGQGSTDTESGSTPGSDGQDAASGVNAVALAADAENAAPVDGQTPESPDTVEKTAIVQEVKAEELKTKEFYTGKLAFTEDIWDLDEVSLKDYPEIRGMEVDEIPIRDEADLQIIKDDVKENRARGYVLKRDIEISGEQNGYLIGGTFKGTFDGGGHTISGLKTPMFQAVCDGIVRDLVIRNADIQLTGNDSAAVLAQNTENSQISRIDIGSARVSGGNRTATLVGHDEGSFFAEIQIRNAAVYSDGLYGSAFIAEAENSSIRDAAVISSTISPKRFMADEEIKVPEASDSETKLNRSLGGFIGRADSVDMENVFCEGDISIGTAPDPEVPAQIKASQTAKIGINEINTSGIDKDDAVAGLIGTVKGDTRLTNVFGVSDIINNDVEGSAGYNRLIGVKDGTDELHIENCYEYANSLGNSQAEETEGIEVAEAEQIADKTFYLNTLHFDNNIWNVNYVSLKRYPELRGMEETKVIITSQEEFLKELESYPDLHYVLETDLDFNDVTDKESVIASVFTGTLEGGGHTVRNLKVPLFKEIYGGVVRNLKFRNASITKAEGPAAVLAEKTTQTTVERLDISRVELSGVSSSAVVTGYDQFSDFARIQIHNAKVHGGAGNYNAVFAGYTSSSTIQDVAVLDSSMEIKDAANGGFIGSAQNGVIAGNIFCEVDVTMSKDYPQESAKTSAGFIGEMASDCRLNDILAVGTLTNESTESGPSAFCKFTSSKDSLTEEMDSCIYEGYTAAEETGWQTNENVTHVDEGEWHLKDFYTKKGEDEKGLNLSSAIWNLSHLVAEDENPQPELKGMEKAIQIELISSVEDFKEIGESKPGVTPGTLCYTLTEDLDFTGTELDKEYVIDTFSETLDGAGHTISGLSAPLFRSLSGNVKNLKIKGSETPISMNGTTAAGVLAEEMKNAEINKIYLESIKISAENGNTALFAGSVSGTTISNILVLNCEISASGSKVAGFINTVSGNTNINGMYLQSRITAQESITGSAGFACEINGNNNAFSHILFIGDVPENVPNVTQTVTDDFQNCYEWSIADGQSCVDGTHVVSVSGEPWNADFYREQMSLSESLWNIDDLSKGYPVLRDLTSEAPAIELEISTPEGLVRMNEIPYGTFHLTSDIDMSTAQAGTLSEGAIVSKTFRGKLEGENHEICGLTQPLFADLQGTVRQLTIRDANVGNKQRENASANILAVKAEGATVSWVFFNGISMNGAGDSGIVGKDSSSHFEYIGVENVEMKTSGDCSGVLIGEAEGTEISNSMEANGELEAGKDQQYIGSMIGKGSHIKVSKVYCDVNLVLPYGADAKNCSTLIGAFEGSGSNIEDSVAMGGFHPSDVTKNNVRYKFVSNAGADGGNNITNCFVSLEEDGNGSISTSLTGLNEKSEREMKTAAFFTSTLGFSTENFWDLTKVGTKWPRLNGMPDEQTKPGEEEKADYPNSNCTHLTENMDVIEITSAQQLVECMKLHQEIEIPDVEDEDSYDWEAFWEEYRKKAYRGRVYKLMNSISFYGMEPTEEDGSFLGEFYGTICGNGKAIRDVEGGPLFSTLMGKIDNLKIEDVHVETTYHDEAANALAKNISGATLNKIYFENVLLAGGSYTALLAGTSENATISEIWAENIDINPYGPMHGSSYSSIGYVGGLIAYIGEGYQKQTISDIYMQGSIFLNGNGQGGIFGKVPQSINNMISNVISNMRLKASKGSTGEYFLRGGLVGELDYSYYEWMKDCISLADAGADPTEGSICDCRRFSGTNNRVCYSDNAVHDCYEVSEAAGIDSTCDPYIKGVSRDSLDENFYKNTMKFSESIWDFSQVGENKYPTQKWIQHYKN